MIHPAGKKQKKRIVWVAPAHGGRECEGLPIDEAWVVKGLRILSTTMETLY